MEHNIKKFLIVIAETTRHFTPPPPLLSCLHKLIGDA